VRIQAVGVWDTVGALGIPTSGGITRLFTNAPFARNNFTFHDTRLSGIVANAFHAIAVDERRPDFMPAFWTQPRPDAPAPREAMSFSDADNALLARWRTEQDVKQRWFPGAHSDVGGGYPDCAIRPDGKRVEIKPPPPERLPEGPLGFNLKYEPLAWMQRCARDCGLAFDFEFVPRPDNAIKAAMHDPMAGFTWKLINFAESNHARPRACPACFSGDPNDPDYGAIRERVINETFDDSINRRQWTAGKQDGQFGLAADGRHYEPVQLRGRPFPPSCPPDS
jgi:hypothetical protein